MRHQRFRVVGSGLALLLAVVGPKVAWAQAQGIALDRFSPSVRGSYWFSADSLDLRGNNRWAMGLVGDWAYKPLVMYDAAGEEIKAVVRHQIFAHLGASVVFRDRIRLGLDLPVLAIQRGSVAQLGATRFEGADGAALGDLRLAGDVRLMGTHGNAATLAAGILVHLPTGSRDYYASDGKVRFAPRLQLAGELGHWVYAARTSLSLRTSSETFAGEPYGNELQLGAALGLSSLNRRLVIGPELWTSTVISHPSKGFLHSKTTPVEALFGAHYDLVPGLRAGVGVGPGMTRGLGSPNLRLLASIEWAPAPAAVKVAPPPPPPDTDGDGIADPVDSCRDQPGIASADAAQHGCPPPDSDGDGILDSVDACPTQAGVANENPKQHGCPLRDEDQDGIIDRDDACPTVHGEPNVDPKLRGCPRPLDTDSDGILDTQDACPKEAGPRDDDPKKSGCPRAILSGEQITILDRVEFATGKATLQPESFAILEAVAKVLVEHPEITRMSVEGHTDNRGAAGLNRKLSAQRAAAVVEWLVAHGIEAKRLTSQGFGPDKPLGPNDTDAGRQNNRRVEFRVVSGASK